MNPLDLGPDLIVSQVRISSVGNSVRQNRYLISFLFAKFQSIINAGRTVDQIHYRILRLVRNSIITNVNGHSVCTV